MLLFKLHKQYKRPKFHEESFRLKGFAGVNSQSQHWRSVRFLASMKIVRPDVVHHFVLATYFSFSELDHQR